MQRLEKPLALVTGAGSGIGLAVAERLQEAGLYVLGADVQTDGALAGLGDAVEPITLDVSSEADWQRVADRVHELGGTLVAHVNCAGIMRALDIDQTDVSTFDHIMAVNARGVFLGCRFALTCMRRGDKPGSIVNVASTTAVKPAPWVIAYAASKAAVVSITRSVALQAAAEGLNVRCNAVLPAAVDTAMVRGLVGASPDPDAAMRELASSHPIGRMITAGEVADTVMFLLGPAASATTGSCHFVDGGLTAG